MATRSLNVVITGDSKPLGVASKQADRQMGGVEKSAGRMGKAVKVGFGVAAVGAGVLVVGLKKSVDAAVDAEKSQAKLKAQLNASGASYRAHAKEIDAVIQKHSRLAGVDDEDLQDAFSGLVRTTGSVSTAMKDMGLVTDIMRGKNVDAAAAGALLSKVHNGNVTALKKMGIALDPVTEAQDKLKESNKDATKEQIAAAKATDKQATAQAGIAELQKRFGGQAAAYGKTAAGAQDRFRVAIENVQEKLGAKLLPVIATVANGVAKFLDQIDRGTGAGGRFATAVGGAFERVKGAVQSALPVASAAFETLRSTMTNVVATVTGIVTGFQQGKGGAVAIGSAVIGLTTAFVAYRVAVGVAAAVTKAYTAVQAALNVVMTANPIGLVVLGLVALGAGLVVAYKKSETFRNIVDGTFKTVKTVVGSVMDWIVPKVKTAFSVVSDVVGVAVKIVRGYVGAYASAAKAIVGAIVGAFNVLKGLPGKVGGFFSDVTKKIREWVGNFASAALEIGKAVGGGIITGLGNLGHLILDKAKDALGFVAKNLPGPAGVVGGAIGSLIGDGVGKTVTALPSGAGLSGGSLDGAKSIMSPFVSMAGRFGLHTSSGLRPGAITSSGNPSFHGTGNAVDEAGTPSGMLGYFRYLKAKFGSRLRELIYTPGGVGIKDGKPFQYTGQVAKDHYDHVHVAYTGGAGDGIGRIARTGDGIGEIKALWTRAGGSSSAQNMAAAIAMAESGGDPGISNRNTDGSIDRGLWQINSVHGSQSTFDRMGNAKAAVSISSNGRNWNPWTVFKTGAYKRFLTSGGSSAGSTPGKGKPTGTTQGGKLPAITPAFYAPAEGPSEDAIAAQGFLDRKAGVTGARPLKGGGPSKGISQETADARANLPEAPTRSDYLNADIARALLTDGTDDDLKAATALRDYLKGQMDAALADADPRNDTDAINAYIAARDAVVQLTGATQDSVDAMKAHTAALESVAAEQKRANDIAGQVRGTSEYQLTKMLADVVSGYIVGRGVMGRSFTPGSGVEAAY